MKEKQKKEEDQGIHVLQTQGTGSTRDDFEELEAQTHPRPIRQAPKH